MMGRDVAFPPCDDYKKNATDLLDKLSQLETDYGKPLTLTGGYRPREINWTVDGSKPGDAHESCRGADLRDTNEDLSIWCMNNLNKLETIGLWLEAPSSSKNHVHVQTYPPHSGRRVFIA